jgi:hypothetical protein
VASDPRQVEVQQNDVRAGHIAGVDAVDVTKHVFAILVNRKSRLQVVMRKGEAHEFNIGRVVFREEDLKIRMGTMTRTRWGLGW